MREIKARGEIRVIVRPEPLPFLPRSAYSVSIDRTISEGLSNELGLELVPVVAEDYSQMVGKLLNGEGDVIAAGVTLTKSRRSKVAFSTPYLYVDELLVVRTGEDMPEAEEDLAGKMVCAGGSSSYMETLVELKQRVPSVEIQEMSGILDTEEVVAGIARGDCFATVVDSSYWEAISGSYENLSAPFAVSIARPIALAVRPESKLLLQKINEFLVSRALAGRRQERYVDDLDGLKKQKVIRMITRNNSMTYFIYRGAQLGFEYEFMKRFAEQNGMRLEIVVPPSHEDLIPWLNGGRGDVIAAAMTVTPHRKRYVAFTSPYNYVEEVVVVGGDNEDIKGPQDLAGRTVHVRKSSSFYRTLLDLKKSVRDLTIVTVPEDMETEELLAGVEAGKWEVTVSDSNLLDVERSYGRNLRAAFTLRETGIGWAVRKDNTRLLNALNEYIEKEYRGLFYNTIKERYFKEVKVITRSREEFRYDISGRISPYDDLVKKYTNLYGLDWRLITAQMYHESRFKPDRVSWAGAIGLMQLMPKTAEELGVRDPRRPQESIKGGVRYMRSLLQRFDGDISLKDRIHFALAAYNVGYGHVADARMLASRMGWSPDEWFGNVEMAMALLEKPRYYKGARYGYCRGSEVVRYVRQIQDRYEAYVKHVAA